MKQIGLWTRFVVMGCLLGAGAPACDDSGGEQADGATPTPERAWRVLQRDLPAAVLSIWGGGPDDVWVVGGDPGTGPLALHLHGGAWETIDTGLSGALWWVFSPTPDAVWWIGEGGLMARYTPSTGAITPVDSGTTATLYGLWGPPEGPLYAVGGDPLDPAVPAVVLQIEGDRVTPLDAPATSVADETWFKVWGTAADDVWIIGDRGSVAHFDGTWTVARLEGAPRLVTLHGGSAEDRVVVGGAGRFVLLEGDATGWTPADIDGLPALNGVFVRADGQASVAGNQGVVAERRGGAWTRLETPPVRADWHATWLDAEGAIWVVGGDLFSEAFDRGAVLRYAPTE